MGWVRMGLNAWMRGRGPKNPAAARRRGAGSWMLFVAAALLCGAVVSDAASPGKTPELRSGEQITKDLTDIIEWYDHISAFTNTPVSVDEALYRDSVRSSAGQSVRLAFDFAKAEANLLAANAAAAPTT